MALAGRVCLVTGASRGIGKGIALQLGGEGATVYITGRTLKGREGSKGSLDETAKEIESRGGVCIPVQCDHSDGSQIESLFNRISEEQNGRLDVLVNNATSALNYLFDNIDKKFYELPVGTWEVFNDVGLRNHYYCTVYASRLMIPRKNGVIIFISSRAGFRHFHSVALGAGKAALDKMALDCGAELREHNIACISLWPGATGTENVKHASSDLTKSAPVHNILIGMFKDTESTEYCGKAITALAKDKQIMKKTGRTFIAADLGDEYGFLDVDGSKPCNMRSVSYSLNRAGYTRLSKLVPKWIKIPKWLMLLMYSKF